ncbi:hypothetical protein [Niastella sp. OAS944]|nr:hypothetical protein [Chitinophagaceae bacterium OAS944]
MARNMACTLQVYGSAYELALSKGGIWLKKRVEEAVWGAWQLLNTV